MSVLTDYFRAADDASVQRRMTDTDGASPLGGEAPFPGVEAEGIDPVVALGALVAAVLGVDSNWDVMQMHGGLVWPESVDGDDSFIARVSTMARDALANLSEGRLAEVSESWARSGDLPGAPTATNLLPLVAALSGLARDARDNGEELYCWL
jgi:hypothetical protein